MDYIYQCVECEAIVSPNEVLCGDCKEQIDKGER